MSEFNKESEIKEKYMELLDFIIENTEDNKIFKVFKENLSDEDLTFMLNKFCKSVEKDKKVKKLFLNRNERVFRNKHAVKIVPSFNLKTLLSKLEKDQQKLIWDNIQLLYILFRTGEPKHKKYIDSLIGIIEDPDKTQKRSRTDNIIMDLANTFKNSLKGNKTPNFGDILKTSKDIAQKYSKDLESGEISFENMMSSFGKMMGDIQEDFEGDDDIKDINLEKKDEILESLGLDKNKKPEDLIKEISSDPMKMVKNMFKGENNPFNMVRDLVKGEGDSNPLNMVNDMLTGEDSPLSGVKNILGDNPMEKVGKMLSGDNNPLDMISKMFGGVKKEDLTEEQLAEMNKFYENLTTDELEELDLKEEKKPNMIGSIGQTIFDTITKSDKN